MDKIKVETTPKIKHHHTIIVGKSRKISISQEDLVAFLNRLVEVIQMKKLFEPIVVHGRYGYTGIVGIVTSHISFHFFEEIKELHLDVYSCKEYDLEILMQFVNSFWQLGKTQVAFIQRDKELEIKKYNYDKTLFEIYEPIEYKENMAFFYDRKYYVDENCYIPTPETERLVAKVIEEIKNGPNIRVLDVGTGSGCLAITIKEECSGVQVFASDKEEEALLIAKKNASKHKSDIEFFLSNYVDQIPDEVYPTHIIANMPWGDYTSSLNSNTNEKITAMPKVAIHHPKGKLTAYEELIYSIEKKGWKTKLFIEVGNIPQHEVEEIVPKNSLLTYFQVTKNYAVARIEL